MTDTYSPSQAVAWIATGDAEWAAATDLQRANLHPSASNALKRPEIRNPHAADDLLSALRAGSIFATDANGDVLPKTKWMAADADHLRHARNLPADRPWLHGVRLDAEKVRKLWPVHPQPTRTTRRVPASRIVAWIADRQKRAEMAGERIARRSLEAECCQALKCSREVFRAVWATMPQGTAKRPRGRPARNNAPHEKAREI